MTKIVVLPNAIIASVATICTVALGVIGESRANEEPKIHSPQFANSDTSCWRQSDLEVIRRLLTVIQWITVRYLLLLQDAFLSHQSSLLAPCALWGQPQEHRKQKTCQQAAAQENIFLLSRIKWRMKEIFLLRNDITKGKARFAIENHDGSTQTASTDAVNASTNPAARAES